MEFFNNIWMAISTPNEGLVNIIVSLATFTEAFLIMTLFLSILNIKANLKQKTLYIISMSFLGIVFSKILPTPINIFFNYALTIILSCKLFKITILKSFLSNITSIVVLALVSTLILNPYLNLLNINYEQSETIPIYRICYLAITYLIYITIIYIVKIKNLKINILDDIDKKNKLIIFINLILGFITLSVQLIITIYYTDKLPIIITFLSFISLLAYFGISIYSLTRIMKLTLTTRKLESAEEYNNTLRILHDNVRAFKHDFDNIVTTIGGFIRTNDMEGLKKYYLQLEDDCQRVNNLYILNPNVVNNDGIYNLLTKKYYEAESKNIKVNITFLLDLSKLNMKIYEFARMLGILLDNAIEASSECEEKIINLSFRDDTKNSRQLITIENTYNNKDVDTEKIFEKGTTGKTNHTGLGLWEVRRIIKKNTNINLFTNKNDKFFIQQLEIYY